MQTTPWNTQELCMNDPFGNRMVFFESIQK
ncbi:hypothetical protein QYF49_09890 [Fictibacillus sp. CENA-BCM004]|uniref:Glyoxalase n=1 Tax=Fictibacillus terranigra TaxID=3058424 RepID=A0ABT8E607_9BACL|nr:hypothetical protein [Fictibacillus sp. CENA-BCM004]MDN4073314.1 hypothetical protein [Fictibacillus sp. CENA-BCM004]